MSLSPEVDQALAQMMAQHEPYPLVVLSVDRSFFGKTVVREIFETFIGSADALPDPLVFFRSFSTRGSCAHTSSIGNRSHEASHRAFIASTCSAAMPASGP